jgi:hypothetical protein
MKILAGFLSLLFILIVVYGLGDVVCSYQNNATASSNTFTAFTSTIWVQTTKTDFQQGLRSQVDIATISGDVLLSRNGNKYRTPGTMTSQVLDTGRAGTKIDLLNWSQILPPSTSITFEIRASDTQFSSNNKVIPWTLLGGTSPVSAGLPKGQYIQWRATLTTSNTSVSPDLQQVEVWYH